MTSRKRILCTAAVAAAIAGGVLAGGPAGALSQYGPVTPAVSGLKGLDVSSHQGNVAWSTVKKNGAKFAYVKATEGTSYQNPYFGQQYKGSAKVGLTRGAYHFATPDGAGGKAQADYFVAHGGGWSADHHTLPGALDIEYNPYGATCYGLSKAAMRKWIHAFVNEYHAKTKRWAVIYSTLDWWTSCTGDSDTTFAKNDPLWIAHPASSAGTLPKGYHAYTIWQYASSGTFPGDQDVFKGSAASLRALADNT